MEFAKCPFTYNHKIAKSFHHLGFKWVCLYFLQTIKCIVTGRQACRHANSIVILGAHKTLIVHLTSKSPEREREEERERKRERERERERERMYCLCQLYARQAFRSLSKNLWTLLFFPPIYGYSEVVTHGIRLAQQVPSSAKPA